MFEKPTGAETGVEIMTGWFFLFFGWKKTIRITGALQDVKQVLSRLQKVELEERVVIATPPKMPQAEVKS